MIKITDLLVCALIGVAFALPASDSVNQRDPVQIKISNDEIAPELVNINNEPIPPAVGEDLKDSFDPETQGIRDESLEPAETFGFGYGLGLGYSGWGGGYRGYNGYGGYGRGYGGYGGYGGGYGWQGRRHGGYGGYGRRSYYW